MIENIAQGIVTNWITKLIEIVFVSKKTDEQLIKDTDISITCTSKYIDYLSGDNNYCSDVELEITNNTLNTLEIGIDIVHARIDGPLLGPFSSPYITSCDKVVDNNGEQLILKPLSEKSITITQFTNIEKYKDQECYINDGILELYPSLPKDEFIVEIDGSKYVSTLAGFYPPYPSEHSYSGVGLVLKISIRKQDYIVVRTLYGGFARRSEFSTFQEVTNKEPKFFQFLSGIYDSGIILIKNEEKVNVFASKTNVINHNYGKFNEKDGYAHALYVVKDNNSPCGAPINLLTRSMSPFSGDVNY